MWSHADFRALLEASEASKEQQDAAQQEYRAYKNYALLVALGTALPGAIFLGLYFWAKANPLPALLSGLVVYVTILLASFALNPMALLSPIAWIIRLAIIGYLASGVRSAMEERKHRAREVQAEPLQA